MRVQVITKVELSDKRINTLSFKIKFSKVRAGVEELLSFVQNSHLYPHLLSAILFCVFIS